MLLSLLLAPDFRLLLAACCLMTLSDGALSRVHHLCDFLILRLQAMGSSQHIQGSRIFAARKQRRTQQSVRAEEPGTETNSFLQRADRLANFSQPQHHPP